MKELLSAKELNEKFASERNSLTDRLFMEKWDSIVDDINWTAEKGGTYCISTFGLPFGCATEKQSKEVIEMIASRLNELGYKVSYELATISATFSIKW